MKKSLIAILLLSCEVFAFAVDSKEKKPINIGFGGGYMYLTESGEMLGSDITAEYHSVAIQLAISQMSDENWGAVTHISFYLPYAISGTIDGDRSSVDMSAYDSIFGMQTSIGFPYYFSLNRSARIGIGPAFDFLVFTFAMDRMTGLGYYWGPGLIVESQFDMSEFVYFVGGLTAFYNCFHFSLLSTPGSSESSFGIGPSVSVKPYIGIGITIPPQ